MARAILVACEDAVQLEGWPGALASFGYELVMDDARAGVDRGVPCAVLSAAVASAAEPSSAVPSAAVPSAAVLSAAVLHVVGSEAATKQRERLESWAHRGIEVPWLLAWCPDATAEQVVALLEGGADGCYCQPRLAPEVVVAHLRAWERHPQGSPRLRVGPLEIDLLARRAHIGESLLELTPVQLHILTQLARNAGRPVNRLQLLRRDPRLGQTASRLKTVDSHIHELRAKLGPFKPWLVAVRSEGYALVDPAHGPGPLEQATHTA
jgi:DNA-binding response OmpR family regulator